MTGALRAWAAMGLLLAGVAGCGSSGPAVPENSPQQGSIELQTIVQQSNPGQGGETVREVVRDEASWRALWAKLREGSALAEEPPAVDFAREMVAVAAMETQSCVSRVTIRTAVRTGNELVLDVLEAPPAPNCTCITSERPIHVVRLPKVDAAERFTVERGQTAC